MAVLTLWHWMKTVLDGQVQRANGKLGVLRPGRVLKIFSDAAPSLLTHKDQDAPFFATVS